MKIKINVEIQRFASSAEIYIYSEDPVSCIRKKSCRTTEQTKR